MLEIVKDLFVDENDSEPEKIEEIGDQKQEKGEKSSFFETLKIYVTKQNLLKFKPKSKEEKKKSWFSKLAFWKKEKNDKNLFNSSNDSAFNLVAEYIEENKGLSNKQPFLIDFKKNIDKDSTKLFGIILKYGYLDLLKQIYLKYPDYFMEAMSLFIENIGDNDLKVDSSIAYEQREMIEEFIKEAKAGNVKLFFRKLEKKGEKKLHGFSKFPSKAAEILNTIKAKFSLNSKKAKYEGLFGKVKESPKQAQDHQEFKSKSYTVENSIIDEIKKLNGGDYSIKGIEDWLEKNEGKREENKNGVIVKK
ncbi:MAG: hypothetical protein PHF26_00755, partial [Candidatus Gracilibacteria bacterium]|nr:hypothetical protein [Candidatus Gracilibacteria bacterium]